MPGGSATHCKECREQGMVDVVSRRCSCGKLAQFGMPDSSATHCKECKEQGMVDFKQVDALLRYARRMGWDGSWRLGWDGSDTDTDSMM